MIKQNICGINISWRLLEKKILRLKKKTKQRLRKTRLDKGSCEQPVDLRKERSATDVHKRKRGCNFQERLVLLRNGLLFPFVLTEKTLAKPGFICCENPERSPC